VQFEFLPWQSGTTELVEHGQLDLVLRNDEGLLPSHFQLERLYKEDWICAVARESHFGDRLSLKQYLAASHIVVSPYEGVQTIPDKQLALLVQIVALVSGYLISAWRCNAFPAPNWFLPSLAA
jgi:DNA-binding transcriptional LysR family regulator